MNNDEVGLLITLRHPDPYTDIEGFMASLPLDFAEQYFYEDQPEITAEERHERATRFYIGFMGNDIGKLSMKSTLKDLHTYYKEKQS